MSSLAAIATLCLTLAPASQAQKPDTKAFRQAQQLYAGGKLAEAERAFNEIARKDPSNVSALMYLGQTLFRERKFSEALPPYERVRALENAGSGLSLAQRRVLTDQLAMAYGISGRLEDSKSLLKESIRNDPEYPLNYYNLACVAADENDKAAVLVNLMLAFRHRADLLPGEQMPNPRTDPSFKEYAGDEDFKALMAKLKQQP